MPAHRGRRFEIALAEGRTPAAFAAVDERDLEPKSFQNFDRRDPDMRLVITNEGVVPENDLAAAIAVASVCDRRIISAALAERRYMLAKPPIEALLRVMRQRTFAGYPQHLSHQTPDHR